MFWNKLFARAWTVLNKSKNNATSTIGFEMIFYSFGSGFDLESTNTTYLSQLKADIAYANSKGIEVGGYDLISLSREVEPEWMAINSDGTPETSACFASGWYDDLYQRVMQFFFQFQGSFGN